MQGLQACATKLSSNEILMLPGVVVLPYARCFDLVLEILVSEENGSSRPFLDTPGYKKMKVLYGSCHNLVSL